ncbi:unnamed protein product [Ilex paraguariensis]|uniref:Uncharacterized protein n=1 Tax=Ilex paraguariensis TaxID=185542 RepID=A0ABC8R8J6_9AQUA
MVMEVVQEDMGEDNMQCTNHPYKNNSPGGICAFCLQEKLGKLVSSSFPTAIFPSSSPSFRSDFTSATTSTLQFRPNPSSSTHHQNLTHKSHNHYHDQHYPGRSKIPFPLATKKKKKDVTIAASDQTSIVFKRSKSTTTPIRGVPFTDESEDHSPHKRGFWSFLHLSKHSSNKKTEEICYESSATRTNMGASINGSFSQQRQREKKKEEFVMVDDNVSPSGTSLDRKVSRSKSVGCGSRSFSGDFFERISTGFGDCALRRVESQREGKPRVFPMHRGGAVGGGQDYMKERVKCGGIFGGFMMATSSSSSSSSSYWVSSSTEENLCGKTPTVCVSSRAGHGGHGRSKSLGWAFASPVRAFSKPPSRKREATNKNTNPNLSAIPSLLAVGG